LRKSAGSVRFWFYKPEIEKTEPNPNRKNRAKLEKNEPNRKKPSQTGLNRFLSKKTELKLVGLNRFRFLKKKINFSFVTYFYKNRTEPKMITPTYHFASMCKFNIVV
jgi:hypothetical protein